MKRKILIGSIFGLTFMLATQVNFAQSVDVKANYPTTTQNNVPKIKTISTTEAIIANSAITDNGGKIGIGITSPETLLHLKGGIGQSYTGTPTMKFTNVWDNTEGKGTTSTTSNFEIGMVNSEFFINGTGNITLKNTFINDNMIYQTGNSGKVKLNSFTIMNDIPSGLPVTNYVTSFINNNITVMTFKDGNIGVGTNAPTQKLDVNGTVRATNFVKSDGSPLAFWNQNGTIVYYNGGNVGIGTNTPSEKLDVNGTVRATNFVKSDGSPLAFWNQNGTIVYYNGGNVGIGTTTPSCKLDVIGDIKGNGSIYLTNNGNTLRFMPDNGGVEIGSSTDNIKFWYSGVDYNNIECGNIITHGNVGIGTTNPTATLTVNGKILAEEVEIIYDVPASDYVFEESYNLKSLNDVEKYIRENKHLPEVPSAADFKTNGYKVGEMDDLLLRKVEELTLYVIEQQKQINKLSEENKELKNMINN